MSNLQSHQAMQLPTLGTGHVPVPSFSRVIGIDPGASGAIALLVSGVLISVTICQQSPWSATRRRNGKSVPRDSHC